MTTALVQLADHLYIASVEIFPAFTVFEDVARAKMHLSKPDPG
jgi:hypothetical protein